MRTVRKGRLRRSLRLAVQRVCGSAGARRRGLQEMTIEEINQMDRAAFVAALGRDFRELAMGGGPGMAVASVPQLGLPPFGDGGAGSPGVNGGATGLDPRAPGSGNSREDERRLRR